MPPQAAISPRSQSEGITQPRVRKASAGSPVPAGPPPPQIADSASAQSRKQALLQNAIAAADSVRPSGRAETIDSA